MIPYGRQDIVQADVDTVVETLRSDFLTQGPMVPKFEEMVCKVVDAEHAVAVNSATSGLHAACLALGLKRKEIVWTTPNTFVATANCALFCGAQIDFVDIDASTFNISISKLEEKLKTAAQTATLPKILIVVHFAGLPVEMDKVYDLSIVYGFKIIEDASHAIGANFKGSPIGSCKYSHATVFSFHPVKIITTMEGGLVTTNDAEIYNKLILYRSHGVTRDKNKFMDVSQQEWYYEQHELGFNYRMTDVQAALGISQLERLEEYINRRHEVASHYVKNLNLPLEQFQSQSMQSLSAYHLFVLRIRSDTRENFRNFIYDFMRTKNIGVNVHYRAVHLQPYYKNLGFAHGDFPQAERYSEEALTLPLHPKLSLYDIDYIIEVFNSVVSR